MKYALLVIAIIGAIYVTSLVASFVQSFGDAATGVLG